MTVLIWIYIFMLGAALGSFALVVADRWGSKRSWVKGRSQCDSCKKTLRTRDLVPLFSWVFSKGTCRHCGKKIPVKYPLAELLSASLLLLVYVWFPYDISIGTIGLYLFIIWLIIHTLCVVLILTDVKSMIMPYALLYPLIGTAVIFRGIILLSDVTHPSPLSLSIGVLVGCGLFASLWLLSNGRWIGDSDILLGLAIAFIVGGVFEVWIAFVIASLFGLVFGVTSAFVSHKQMRKMKIPFGPFLIIGMIMAFLFSQQIIDGYLNLFLFY